MPVSSNLVRDTCLSITKEGEHLRIVWSRSVPKKGYVPCDDKKVPRDKSASRLDSSFARTRSTVRQYAACNEWDYFVTFTINPGLFDSFDLHTFYKSFSSYFKNLNQRRGDGGKLLYMLIPEQHKSGAWHFHGLVSGVPDDYLHQFVIGDTMGKGIADKVKVGEEIYHSPSITQKFGYNTFSPVRDHWAVALYVTKYVTKDAIKTDVGSGYRFVLASHGLKKAKKLRQIYGFSFTVLKKYLGEFDYKTDDFAVLTFHPASEGVDEERWLQDIDDLFVKQSIILESEV